MGLFRNLIKSVNEYYNPPADNKSLTSGINQYEWFDFGASKSFGADKFLLPEQYYRSFAYACINARQEKAITADLSLLQRMASGKTKPIDKHPFLDLINKPNQSGQSFKELIYLIGVYLDLSDKGAFLYYPKNALKMPVGLYVLPSQNVTFEYNADRTAIQRYIYTWGSQAHYYLPEEIIHFRIPDPNRLFWSKPTAAACRYSLNIDLFQSTYQEHFYLNDAAIGLVFETEPGKTLNDDVYKRLDKQITDKYTNPEMAGKPFIAEGMKVNRAGSTPKEADYSKSRQMLKDEICGIFRTPKSILGFVEDVNRANAEASNHSFLVNTVIPWTSLHIWSRLEQFARINYDERIILDANYNLEEPPLIQIQRNDNYVDRGIFSRNEVRIAEGKEPAIQLDADGKNIMDQFVIKQPAPQNQNQDNQNQNANENQQ